MTLSVQGITKRFGDLVANNDVGLELESGALHAVLGENGAGKSTLMKILSGILSPDSGTITLDGQPVPQGSPGLALESGIGMLHQEPLVCLPFTNRENFRLGSNWSTTEAEKLMVKNGVRLGFNLDPHRVTRGLTIGERQQLEIVRLLAAGVRVLILDEPTSGITAGQRTELFAALRRLASEGLIVLFVSHKLAEVNELCRSVTVIRRGQVVGTSHLPQAEADLVQLMFDRAAPSAGRSPIASDGTVVAELKGVAAGVGRSAITDVDLEIRAGEVIGLAGLEGSGQGALLRALAGLAHVRTGQVVVGGRDLTHKANSRFVENGVAFLSGGRLEEGLIPGLTVAEHLELADGRRRLIDWDQAEARTEESIETNRIKGEPGSRAEQLSGGNQQRLLLALLPARLRLLAMEHPTRGLDLESAAYVWTRLLDRRRDDTAIVFASSDLDELLAYADRLLVCFDGKVIAHREATSTTVEQLGALIGGKVAV